MLRRLDAAARGKLALVVAPHGYGKSVLLAQWAATRRDLGAFVSFDHVTGLGEVVSAFAEPLAGLRPALIDLPLLGAEADESATDPHLLGRLAAVLDSVRESVFVIDCFDRLEPPSLRQDVLALIAQTAPHIHFVAAARSHLPLPQIFNEIRLQNDVAYVGEDDLLFDRDEARDLLRRESRRRLDDDDVGALIARTEGWPTGLHLAALSLRAADDVVGWAGRFDGTDAYVASYFTEVVLHRCPPELQRFLLTTALIDQLTPSLCDAVTGTHDAGDMLHLLDQHSALRRIVVRGNEVFRHHPLFRDYLRSRFAEQEPEHARRVLVAAADWYLENDETEEAVPYLIGAREWERVLDAVATTGRTMHEQARTGIPLAWLEAVPPSVRDGRTDLVLTHAVLRNFVGDTLGAEEILRGLGPPHRSAPGTRVVADVLRSSWVESHLAPDAAIQAADNVLAGIRTLRDDELVDVFGMTSRRDVYVIASTSRARATWYQGDVAGARVALEELLEQGEFYPTWHINILGTLALLEAWSGQLEQARRHATYTFRIAAETRRPLVHPTMVNAHLAMAHVLIARNETSRAEIVLRDAFEAVATARYHMSLAMHDVESADLEQACGRPRATIERLREAEQRQPVIAPLIAARMRALKARALLDLGEPLLAERALGFEATGPTIETAAAAIHLTLERVDLAAARAVLEAWPRDGSSWSEVNFSLARALVDDAAGDRRAALATLQQVVAATEPEGHVQLFIEAGPRAQRLLRALFLAEPTSYLRRITRAERANPSRLGTATGELLAPLSAREMLVLRHLTSRMTHAEIAAQLFVSLNTIKTQVHSIYTKLGARGRSDAIDKAEELGLL